jgi:sigma-54 specific flagellar transcriptional regulator A
VAEGRFREDLFHRLNVIHVHMPPLRARGKDVRLLAEHFFVQALARSGRTDLRGLSPATLDAIECNAWIGNVRALENAIERGVLLAVGPFVEPDDALPVRTPANDEPPPESAPRLRASVEVEAPSPPSDDDASFPRELPESGLQLFAAAEAYQNSLIRQALARTAGNKNRAAKLLGLNRTTLVEMIRRRGLQDREG